TKTALRVFNTSERITLANTATAEIPVAMAALIVWKPSALTMTTASRKLGIASSTSTSRASTTSTTPPRNPESRPIRPPTTTPITTATSALDTDDAVPWTTRANSSRPRWSVPNQWAALGAWNRSAGTPITGSWLVNRPGAIDHATTTPTTTKETRTLGGSRR